MENNTKSPSVNEEKIISRLKFFNYKYKSEGNTLRIYLPVRCALKIAFNDGSVSMTSSFWKRFQLGILPFAILIALVFCIGTGILLQIDIWRPIQRSSGILIIASMPLLFILKLIITENMKSIVHNWMDNDARS
jgi:hypothetical protein